MNGIRKNSGKRLLAAGLVLCVCLGAFLSFWAAGGEDALGGFEIAQESEPTDILLLQETDGQVLLVTAGFDAAEIYRFDPAGGEPDTLRVEGAFGWAAVRDGNLLLWDSWENQLAVTPVASQPLEAGDPIAFSWAGVTTMLDSNGTDTVYGKTATAPRNLQVMQGGEYSFISYDHEIQFLAVDENGQPVVYTDGVLHVGEELFDCPETPTKLLGGGVFVDELHTLRRIGAEGIEPMFQLPAEPVSGAICRNGQGTVLVAGDGNAVMGYAEDGQTRGRVVLAGKPLGVCPLGAVYRQDSALYFAAFGSAFAVEEPTPGPTEVPTESPSPEPTEEPSEEPGGDRLFELRGNYLVARAGTGIDQLRAQLYPEAGDIRDAEGNPVASGLLATGMTANAWTVVVLGDCDGTGTVTGADLRTAMGWCLEEKPVEDAYGLAADLDEDRAITTRDTVAISRMLSGEGSE